MSQSDSRAKERGRMHRGVFWITPAVAVAGGIAYLVASVLGGHPVLGVVLLLMMLAFAALLVLVAQHSETVRGLMDHRDERIAGIDLRATALTGVVLSLAVIGGAVVDLERGRSGTPYTWLAVVGGVTYIVSVVVQRVRQ
jgi:cobalamin biosynthesis protein CobD/CbiB